MRNRNKGNIKHYAFAAAIVAALVVGFILGRSRPPVESKRPVAVRKAAVPIPEVKRPALPDIMKNFSRPRIAIVIDDFGYNTNNLETFLSIGEPITLAILPNQRYSADVARVARSRGYETILHLPLEPKGGSAKEEPGTIKSSMSDSQVISRLKEELDSVPYIDGVSNHMGSKGTEDARLMALIFGELKKRKLFFFDSLTSPGSVCRDTAKSFGIRYARRDIFLDITGGSADIEKRILEMRRLAFRRGYAIAIGHDRNNTAKALAKLMPALAAEGVDFVRISDVVK